jgi:ribose transport system substrate-binding protein
VVAVGVAALAVGCGGSSSGGGSTASGGSSSSSSSGSAGTTFKPPPFTVPPGGASVLKLAPGPSATGPQSKSPIVLPFWGNFPVKDGPIGDATKTYTFCVSQSLIHPFTTGQRDAVALEAARHPNVKIVYLNTNNDAAQQIQDMNSCMNRKAAGVMIYPQAVAPLTPVIEKLTKAGIPIVGMERTVATNKFLSWIYLDTEKELGLLVPEICKTVGNKGKVVEMPGVPGSSPAITRHGYFVAAMKKNCPNVQLGTTPATDFSAGTGYSVGLTFLRSPASNGVSAIYVHSNGESEGLVRAMKQVGKKIPIFGIDADRKQIGLIKDGWIAGAVDHNPLHGDVALRLLIQHIEGKKVPLYVLETPLFLITKANADKALNYSWGPS